MLGNVHALNLQKCKNIPQKQINDLKKPVKQLKYK